MSSNSQMKTTKSRKCHQRELLTALANHGSRYRIGDSFFSLPVPEVQELLTASVERIDGEVSAVEDKLGELREEMQELKAALYGRFGKSINLEA